VKSVLGNFDTVVAGGGPAGAATALALAREGARVAVVDKARFPREKACGGGLQAKLLQHAPVDLGPVIRNTMHGTSFTCRLDARFDRLGDRPLVYGVRRIELDAFLVGKAIEAGCTLFDKARVEGFESLGERGVRVQTSRGVLHAEALVGADGASGRVRRALNPESEFFLQAGISVEVPRELINEEAHDERLARVDWGTLPAGYGWVFPKAETVNVGVGGPLPYAPNLRRYFRRLVLAMRLLRQPEQSLSKLKLRGHKLPSLTERTRLRQDNVLLVGDAAGLLDPFTGDGLSYGLHSAALAARQISLWLAGDEAALEDYPRILRQTVAPELIQGRKLMSVFHTFASAFHTALREDEDSWKDLCEVLRGSLSYREFYVRRLGPLRVVQPAIDRFSRLCERRCLARGQRTRWLAGSAAEAVVGAFLRRA